MKQALLILGASALAIAAPAVAKPGNGHGDGKGHNEIGHASKSHGHASMSHGHGHHAESMAYGYGHGGCPPGLAKKNNGCLPPGKARKLYNSGQRYPGNYGSLWSYNQIPTNLRSQYNLDRSNRYYYGDGYLYQVDPKTRLIEQVVSAIVR